MATVSVHRVAWFVRNFMACFNLPFLVTDTTEDSREVTITRKSGPKWSLTYDGVFRHTYRQGAEGIEGRILTVQMKPSTPLNMNDERDVARYMIKECLTCAVADFFVVADPDKVWSAEEILKQEG